MFRIILIFLFVIFVNMSEGVFAFDIVYPKKDNVTINADKTFFIGNEQICKSLKINGQPVILHQSGGFKHTVHLDYGVNSFVIDNGADKKVYKIVRPAKSVKTAKERKFIHYGSEKIIKTSSQNVTLRSSPVDAGLNRLQHLQKDIELVAIGEYGDFYKVRLGRDDTAWISKSNTQISDSKEFVLGVIKSTSSYEDDDFRYYKFTVDKKVPYVLSESGLNGYNLVLYNMSDELYNFGKYEFNISQKGKNFGYSAYYNDENELIVKIRKYKSSLKGLKIVIDPGHGGSERGAIGCLCDAEKDVNLAIALKLRNKLQKLGAEVLLTRADDKYLGLQERVNFTNENNAQMFVSIHNNALADSQADKEAKGTEVYYFYSQSRYLAKVISKMLSSEVGFKNRGAKGGSFAVIRNSECPAVLIEVGFMIDPDENSKLINSDFQEKIADGIIKGIEKYFKEVDMEIILGK